MALAASLIPGFQYRIIGGALEGEVVTIVDNTPFPDGDPEGRQRKVTVLSPEGDTYYILPRLLEVRPVGMVGQSEDDAPIVPEPAVAHVEVPVPAVVNLPVVGDVVAGDLALNPITDPMDSRLDHLRPSKAKVKRYVSRTMANGMTDIDFLLTFASDHYRGTNEGRPANTALKGDTQSGKTMLVEVLAVKWSEMMGLPKPMPVFTLSGSSGITDFDLFGQTTSYTDANGRERLVWLPGVVELACKVGGILYLDEWNAMGERVNSSLHPVTDHRHQFINRNKAVWRNGQFMPEVVTASLDLWVIATYNEGYSGMAKVGEAINNRFNTLRWGYDKEVEAKLIKSPAIRLLGDHLRMAREKNSLRTPVGTSALERAEYAVEAFGPVAGLSVLVGMFPANEQAVVEAIIEDRSIIIALNEEIRQARIESRKEGEGA